MSEAYAAIPQELRDLDQWCVAAADKSPWSTEGYRADVTNPETWTDFYSACMVAEQWGGAHIGFVTQAGDGLTCIDLDVKGPEDYPENPEKWTSQDVIDGYHRAIAKFDSYTEYSRSGKGFHIWVRASIGAGARRGGVEVYSQERFLICTGNVYLDRPIADRQELVDQLVASIRTQQGATQDVLVEVESTLTDEQVWNTATTASNAAKFISLWNGQWQGMPEYPSQSEADLSLMSMLTFYSKSNEQCRRMFRLSMLGAREKATKNNYYLDNTLKLIRGRMEAEAVTLDQMRASFEKLMTTVKVEHERVVPVVSAGELEWPPGFVGEVARWMYAHAPRPVKEVAIVAALGVFAGVCGRAFNVNGSGLNLYIVLVAKSAVGKEAMHTGISKLAMEVSLGSPTFSNHLDFAEYASGPALIKSLVERSSFVNIAGEWGRKLRSMGNDEATGPYSSLRTAMTNLYQKSGAGTMVGGLGYSDKEKDVKSVDGIAYSMIGETTPDTFYESLTNTMMQDGFMSRFIVIEYNGLRPELTNLSGPRLGPEMKNRLSDLALAAMNSAGLPAKNVEGSDEAKRMLADFDKHCDNEINSTEDESWRQMWNRAHLKALKVSALLAVAENPNCPVVQPHQAEWALELVKRDIRVMSRKIEDGDVGNDDFARERKMLAVLRDYLRRPVPKSYGVSEAMRTQGYVPKKYLQIRVQKVNSFIKYRNGHNEGLEKCLKYMCDNGYIVDIPAGKLPIEHGFQGKCFRIVNLPPEV